MDNKNDRSLKRFNTLIKIIKGFHYPFIFLYFFCNVIRLIPLFMFDSFPDNLIIGKATGIIIMLLLLILLLFVIEIVLFYPAFKAKGFSFVEVFIYNKNDFKKIIYYVILVLFWINVIILLSFAAIVSIRSDGQPHMIESSYYFVSHGDIVEEIGYSEYKLYKSLIIQWDFSMPSVIFFLMGGFAKHVDYIIE